MDDTSIEISDNQISVDKKEDVKELRNLRKAAKIASIYHRNDHKFQRNRKLSHIVHASLNLTQCLLIITIEIFHHVHHYVNRRLRETNENLPMLPEERNLLFFLYPICMLISLILAILWSMKKFLPKRPVIAFIGCTFGAISMLSAGILEMKQADWHIDLREVTDMQLLDHPIFVHNFSMCTLSIFVMTFYLIHLWILFDVWQRMRKFGRLSDYNESEYSSCMSTSSGIIEDSSTSIHVEQPGTLDPIPTLSKFLTETPIDYTPIDDESVILYCCCIDYYNYIKESRKRKPKHEFQVIHIL